MNYFSCGHFSEEEIHKWLDNFLPGYTIERKIESFSGPAWCKQCCDNRNAHFRKNWNAEEEFRGMSTELARYKTQYYNLKKKLKGN